MEFNYILAGYLPYRTSGSHNTTSKHLCLIRILTSVEIDFIQALFNTGHLVPAGSEAAPALIEIGDFVLTKVHIRKM